MLRFAALLLAICLGSGSALAQDKKPLPPGWLPVNRLDDKTPWADVRQIEDKVQLYLPRGDKPVRGIFLCVVFHSGDPREVAHLWDFALVTIPWEILWDVGLPDKRSKRPTKTKLPMGDMAVILRYLEEAARETKHPELAVAPIVGWMMQGGNHHVSDLYKRAPDRIIAFVDSFENQLLKHAEILDKVPYAIAWEFGGKTGEKFRLAERDSILPKVKDKPTPPSYLLCKANTYGFPHGIYSKWNFFMLFLHRLIMLRLPDDLPPPGQPTKLKAIRKEDGWVGDFNPVSEWNPIAPYAQAKGMVTPIWLPDEYTAWSWRSYHSANPDLKLTAPVIEYHGPKQGKDRKACGLGYGNVMKAGTPLTFAAETSAAYAKIEFHDGDKIVGTAEKAPWRIENIRLERGLHALFAVGVTQSGERKASRAAFLVIE